jgi:hypothetical protein
MIMPDTYRAGPAVSSKEENEGQHANDAGMGHAKVGKPVRRTHSGLLPPETQVLSALQTGAHTATPDTKTVCLSYSGARLRKCFQEAKLW